VVPEPSRASQDSLGITYEEGDQIKIVRPDFIFFSQLADGTIAAEIVDPHGAQFGEALPKLKGLARYAEAHKGTYRRVEAVAKVGNKFRVLDLTEPSVRKAIETARTIKALYDSDAATDYLIS
jgi:type III restriction enzyme